MPVMPSRCSWYRCYRFECAGERAGAPWQLVEPATSLAYMHCSSCWYQAGSAEIRGACVRSQFDTRLLLLRKADAVPAARTHVRSSHIFSMFMRARLTSEDHLQQFCGRQSHERDRCRCRRPCWLSAPSGAGAHTGMLLHCTVLMCREATRQSRVDLGFTTACVTLVVPCKCAYG